MEQLGEARWGPRGGRGPRTGEKGFIAACNTAGVRRDNRKQTDCQAIFFIVLQPSAQTGITQGVFRLPIPGPRPQGYDLIVRGCGLGTGFVFKSPEVTRLSAICKSLLTDNVSPSVHI